MFVVDPQMVANILSLKAGQVSLQSGIIQTVTVRRR